MRTMRVLSRKTSSTRRGSLSWRAAQLRASADGSTSASATTRPSAFETTFWQTTRTSPLLDADLRGGDRARELGREVVAGTDLRQPGIGRMTIATSAREVALLADRRTRA